MWRSSRIHTWTPAILIYINDLATVSKACLSILFADDSNVFISRKDVEIMCEKLNNDMEDIRQWLCCNKLSLNVSKTHYMVFTPRNKQVENLNIKIQNTNIERVSVTKFLGVMIDAQLSWKCHIEYTCKKISKCLGVILKARKKLNKSVLLNLYYSFAYPYFIYCNHVWGNTYPTNLNKMIVLQKKLIRIVTCSPYRAHNKPLLVANNVLSVNEINVYIVGIFMYNYCHDHLPNLFDGFFQRINEVHDRNTRQSNELHVKFARTDVRKFSLRMHGARIWNDIPMHIKHATSVNVFKQMLKKHLIDTNFAGNCHTILTDLFIDWLLDDRYIVWCHLDTVSSLQNPHKRYPIAHPWWGRDMGCLLWAQDLFHVLPQLLQLWIQYCYIGPHYYDIRLYAFQRIMTSS